MSGYNLGCPYIDYQPNEVCKCFLLGYGFDCGSVECKEAIDAEENVPCDSGINQEDLQH